MQERTENFHNQWMKIVREDQEIQITELTLDENKSFESTLKEMTIFDMCNMKDSPLEDLARKFFIEAKYLTQYRTVAIDKSNKIRFIQTNRFYHRHVIINEIKGILNFCRNNLP